MSDIKTLLVEYFNQAGINYRSGDDPGVFLAPFQLDAGDAMLLCYCRDEVHELLVRVLFPFHAPSEHRSKTTEFITRVNHALSLGCFEMDVVDGAIGFRIGIDGAGDHITPALIHNLIDRALTAADYFYVPLAAVALGGAEPTQALEMT